MKTKTKSNPALRPLKDVIEEIQKTFGHDGFLGVKGFKITCRTDKSTVGIEWGDTRVRR